MLSIGNKNIEISSSENGKGLSIKDLTRGTDWALDENTLVYGEIEKYKEENCELKKLEPLKSEAKDKSILILFLRAGEDELQLA